MARAGSRSTSFAGMAALGAGLAWVGWAVINTRTHGGLDAGVPAVSVRTARLGALLMVAWNLLLLPAACLLGGRFAASPRARVATYAGVIALLFWAYGGATHGITPALEVSYLVLSAIWWGGIGLLMRDEWPAFGWFTLLLASFALWDALLTAFEPVPFALYLTAAPKLPLSIAWDFWLAVLLLRQQRDTIPTV